MYQLKGVDPMNNETNRSSVPAGCFSSWLRRTRHGLANEKEAVVPCGDCKACCISSYFIHIRPEETKTRSRINKKLLFPAPGLPKGNMLLGYFENGFCPMMIDDRCSIYEDRPLTCRTYDCRIFTAAGTVAGDEDKALINQRVLSWKFSYPTQSDRNQHSAVQAAALFLREHTDCFPAGVVPNNPSQLAILAIKVYDVFLKINEEISRTGCSPQDSEVAQAIMAAQDKFAACTGKKSDSK